MASSRTSPLLLRMPLDDAFERLSNRGAADRMEREDREFHLRVANAFLLATTTDWQTAHPEIGPVSAIDASLSVDEVTTQCIAAWRQNGPERFGSLLSMHPVHA